MIRLEPACNEIVTLSKYDSKYKKNAKMDDRISQKIEDRSIKIARVNSILVTKLINLPLFTLILEDFGGRCDLGRFSVISPFIEKSMLRPEKRNRGGAIPRDEKNHNSCRTNPT